jgi:hypothetical protein
LSPFGEGIVKAVNREAKKTIQGRPIPGGFFLHIAAQTLAVKPTQFNYQWKFRIKIARIYLIQEKLKKDEIFSLYRTDNSDIIGCWKSNVSLGGDGRRTTEVEKQCVSLPMRWAHY